MPLCGESSTSGVLPATRVTIGWSLGSVAGIEAGLVPVPVPVPAPGAAFNKRGVGGVVVIGKGLQWGSGQKGSRAGSAGRVLQADPLVKNPPAAKKACQKSPGGCGQGLQRHRGKGSGWRRAEARTALNLWKALCLALLGRDSARAQGTPPPA